MVQRASALELAETEKLLIPIAKECHARGWALGTSGNFSATIGPKTEPLSYESISKALERSLEEIVFISDVGRELDGAKTAGLQALLCIRPGHHPQPENSYGVIRSLKSFSNGSVQPRFGSRVMF